MRIINYPQNYINYLRIGHLPTSAYLRDGSIHSPTNTIKELRNAARQSRQVLCTATTVFPFTLVPDTVTLDREKLTIAHRFFFRIAEVISVRIQDILNVAADVGPFFGSLKITSRFFDARKPYRINYLWRRDALQMKRILQGYLIARKNNVDCSTLSTPDLRKALDELGTSEPEDTT